MIGDRGNPSNRLLDDKVVEALGIGFDRIRRIPAERRTINLRKPVPGGMTVLEKLDEDTLRPEAAVALPVAPHELTIAVEWPLPGTADWLEVPTSDCPWTIAPEELSDLEGNGKLDCSEWLGQQLVQQFVMFDQRGVPKGSTRGAERGQAT